MTLSNSRSSLTHEAPAISVPTLAPGVFAAFARKTRAYYYRLLAVEISKITLYFDQTVQYAPFETDTGVLLESIECRKKLRLPTSAPLPDLSQERTARTAILINGNFNHECDIQDTLNELKAKMARTSRIVAILYNPYLAFLFYFATRIGLRKGRQISTFVTFADLANLAQLCGFEIVKARPVVYVPWRLLGVGDILNMVLPVIPWVRSLSFVNVMVFRPVIPEAAVKPSLSIVIPARNEYGNIENAIRRLPNLGCAVEVIFVEGHSKDQTWDEIQRVMSVYKDQRILAFRQTGQGKSDAVREGFKHATGDLLTILDADLTMPPEQLGRFYNAYCAGQADFVNGSRLLYPMENQAMRVLNKFGNKFFAKALSLVLGNRLTDSLCGTKLLARHDYTRMCEWRRDFGDFDPFGDFELIFPASILGLGIIDIPIAYKNRVYGTTQIRRFYHGLMLLRMVLVGFFRIAMGKI